VKVAVLQSNYIPWKGYFDIIHDVDLFIFYDDVQYTRNDWRNRNRIKSRQGSSWLTIPVHGGPDDLIHEVGFADPRWQQQHWRTLSQTYARSPFFAEYRALLEPVYLGTQWSSLSTLNQHLVRLISHKALGIETRFADSREYRVIGSRQDRLLDLLAQCGTKSYVSGPAAREYIDESRFVASGIELIWKDYSGYPEYRQLSEPFEHAVSVLDLLFNIGPDAPRYIWGWRER
jgi:hypothetical protein